MQGDIAIALPEFPSDELKSINADNENDIICLVSKHLLGDNITRHKQVKTVNSWVDCKLL